MHEGCQPFIKNLLEFKWKNLILLAGWKSTYRHRIIHLLIRISIIAVLIVFLIHCISSYDLYMFKPLWVVETLIFIAFLVIYLIRKDPVNRSSGTKEIIVPLIGGMLPFALLFSPPNLFIAGNPLALQIIFYWMTAATALTVWGLWTLRRSFSITVEARDLVISGPYRWIRHPIYSGEILAALAVTVWRFSLLNIFIITLFCCYPIAKGKMGGEQACAGVPRLLYLRGQNEMAVPIQQTITPCENTSCRGASDQPIFSGVILGGSGAGTGNRRRYGNYYYNH